MPFVHGADGQGDINLPDPAGKAVDISAAQFIVEQVRANPGAITLVPVGPLTNIALALRLEPRIAEWVDEVVLMGGNALVPGNASPAGEANIRNDPEAADLVFGADWQVTMVGLDVTLRVHMKPEHIAEYATHGNPMSDHITRTLPHYRDYFESNYEAKGIFVHDSSAIAYVIDPSLFTCAALAHPRCDAGLGAGQDLARHRWPHLARLGGAPLGECLHRRRGRAAWLSWRRSVCEERSAASIQGRMSGYIERANGASFVWNTAPLLK